MDNADLILALEMLIITENICKYSESLPKTMLLTLNFIYFWLFHILWKVMVGSHSNSEVQEVFVSLSLSLLVQPIVG